jgi:hyperosmotically inducible periplasmic protein
MTKKALFASRILVSACLLTAAGAFAQDSSKPAPDNTKINQRDRDSSQPTADQQKNNSSDEGITQQIRQAVIKDKALSSYAHNVKIISQDGMVTLKGPVRSEEDKQAIAAKAAAVVGADKVSNELEVKPEN